MIGDLKKKMKKKKKRPNARSVDFFFFSFVNLFIPIAPQRDSSTAYFSTSSIHSRRQREADEIKRENNTFFFFFSIFCVQQHLSKRDDASLEFSSIDSRRDGGGSPHILFVRKDQTETTKKKTQLRARYAARRTPPFSQSLFRTRTATLFIFISDTYVDR